VKKFLLLTGVAALAVTSQANATPANNWTGFYAGLNAGGAWGTGEVKDLDGYNLPGLESSHDTSGFTGGGQIGYNHQFFNQYPFPIVLGLESDVGYLGNDGKQHLPSDIAGGDTSNETSSDLYVTARARIGVPVLERYLVYATGGYLGANTRARTLDDCNTGTCGGGLIDAKKDTWRHGWTMGGGIEALAWNNWTVKAEYLRYGLNTEKVSGVAFGGGTFNFDHSNTGNIVRLGVNYRFNPATMFGR